MSEVAISYKGSNIATMDASGTKTLLTQGKYCEDDIDVVYTRPATPAPTLQTKTKTYTPTESQQTESIAADSGYDGLSAVNVTVNAMPSGTAGTPTATKGTVSNHAVSVTPSVTNTTGYITGGTKTGTAVSVSASELVSGNKSITSNGTNIDVANYATVSVNVSAGMKTATGVISQDSSAVTIAYPNILTFSNLEKEPDDFVIAQVGTPTNTKAGSSPLQISLITPDKCIGPYISNSKITWIDRTTAAYELTKTDTTMTVRFPNSGSSSIKCFFPSNGTYVLFYT